VLSVLIAGTGVGVALSGSRWKPVWANGTIHQCLNNKTFATRTLPRGKKCSSKETAYSFNQTGPRGLRGAPGLGASVITGGNGQTPPQPTGGRLDTIKSVTITTTEPGSLLVLDASTSSVTVNNTSDDDQHYYVGIYVDGRGVPGAVAPNEFLVGPKTTANLIDLSFDPGRISGIKPGRHTVTIALIALDTTTNFLTGGSGKMVVIATG
jgi:hypothetical protein